MLDTFLTPALWFLRTLRVTLPHIYDCKKKKKLFPRPDKSREHDFRLFLGCLPCLEKDLVCAPLRASPLSKVTRVSSALAVMKCPSQKTPPRAQFFIWWHFPGASELKSPCCSLTLSSSHPWGVLRSGRDKCLPALVASQPVKCRDALWCFMGRKTSPSLWVWKSHPWVVITISRSAASGN